MTVLSDAEIMSDAGSLVEKIRKALPLDLEGATAELERQIKLHRMAAQIMEVMIQNKKNQKPPTMH